MPSPWKCSPAPSFSALISSVNWRSTDEAPDSGKYLVPQVRVLHDFGPIEGRAQHGRVRVFSAEAAAHAAVDYRSDRFTAQRIRVVLDGERRATGQADARVIAGARVLVHAVLDSDDSFA